MTALKSASAADCRAASTTFVSSAADAALESARSRAATSRSAMRVRLTSSNLVAGPAAQWLPRGRPQIRSEGHGGFGTSLVAITKRDRYACTHGLGLNCHAPFRHPINLKAFGVVTHSSPNPARYPQL